MGKKISNEEIILINELYQKIGTYSGVAKKVGRCPSTIKKYIIKDFEKIENKNIKIFNKKITEIDFSLFKNRDWGKICELSSSEKEGIKELWKELLL